MSPNSPSGPDEGSPQSSAANAANGLTARILAENLDFQADNGNLGGRRTGAGKVFLVGAGPGEPGAITLRAIECLQFADAILFDYLVNPALLRWAHPTAKLISLGKHGDAKRMLSQAQVNQMMVSLAQEGKKVVRLKCGDPIVFARAAEETSALLQAMIPFEIVPGVTSALAAGSYAGVALTHRDHASAVALITGHPASGSQPDHIDWASLAKFPGTLVVYMGTTQVEYWATELLKGGKPDSTPVGIVRRCSFHDQTVVETSLGKLIQTVTTPKRIRPPVIFLVGDVATNTQQLNWFQNRPLFGQTVLVTRPVVQSDQTLREFEHLGACTLSWPGIEINPVANHAQLDHTIANLRSYDWVVFSSVNGVDSFLNRMWELGLDSRDFGQCKIATIGQKTNQSLSRFHLKSDYVPKKFDADHLADHLVDLQSNSEHPLRILLIRASRGRDDLAVRLSTAGAKVDQAVAYLNQDAAPPSQELIASMATGNIDWVTVTSSAIARNLVQCFGEHLRATQLVSISPLTSQVLRDLKFEVAAEAETYTSQGIVQAICELRKRQQTQAT